MASVMREATHSRLSRTNPFADLHEKQSMELLGKRRDNESGYDRNEKGH